MLTRRSLISLSVVLACACAPTASTAQWSDYVAAANGVAFRAPRSYTRRNEFGCWTSHSDRWGASGWRDFCVDTLDVGESYSFTSASTQGCSADCVTFEDLRVDTTVVEGSRVIVERARATGGFQGMRRERQILVRVQGGDSTIVLLHGSTGDDAGYDELLAIATSMRPFRESHVKTSPPPT